MVTELQVTLRKPHKIQQQIVESSAKRKVIRAGRRSGKTCIAALIAVKCFLDGGRVLYGAPTGEQLDTFWREVKRALAFTLDAGVYHKDETKHIIEVEGTENRIRAKTCWNADTLRGDYASLLILDEYQLMNEDTWAVVGAPMLLDNDGDAIFIYTPPSLRTKSVTKAKDPLHAAKLFVKASEDETGRWETFHFSSKENPHISSEALDEIVGDMSQVSYRQEILAEDDLEAAWKGLIYKTFNTKTCVIPRFPIPESWLIYSGHDFGGGNPAALFTAEDPSTGFFYHFHEYLPGGGRSTAQHVEEFKEITKGYNVIKRIGGNWTSEDEIRQGYSAHGWHIQAPKHKNVLPQIDRVIGLHELNKVFVFEDLYNYLYEKANFSWKLDDDNQPTREIQDEAKWHLMSCERTELDDFTPETTGEGGGRKLKSKQY